MTDHDTSTFTDAAAELEARVEALELAVFEPDDPPPVDPPDDPGPPSTLVPDLPPAGGTWADDHFDAHAPTAFARWSGRTQQSVDRYSMGNPKRIRRGDVTTWPQLTRNHHVTIDPQVGAAGHPAGAPNEADLYLPLGLERPAGNTWLISWCTRVEAAWLPLANRDDDPAGFPDRPWRNTKLQHLTGRDAVADPGDGVLKVNLRFPRASARVNPEHIAYFFAETRHVFTGENVDDHAPFSPSGLGDIPVFADTWYRTWVELQEGRDLDEHGLVSVWLEDESRAIKAINGLLWRVPYDPARDQGITALHLFSAPKPAQTLTVPPPRIFWKNLLVQRNPLPAERPPFMNTGAVSV